jgi:transcriptional regulator with XRE-family HTH domain
MGKNISKLFGKRLRFYRKEKGLSQEALGFEVDLEKSAISHYELGTRCPNLKIAQKLAEALDVTLAQLVSFD